MNTVLKDFVKYVSSNIMGMIGLSCYILADTFFIARGVGADGLTSLNLAIPVYSFINGIGLMISMGSATRYSISRGNGDRQAFRDIFSQAVYFTAVMSAVIVILGITSAESLSLLLGADSATLNMTASYLKILMLFTPFFMCNNLLTCFVRNDGAPELAMAGMLLGTLSNIVLDYLFIFPLHLGMKGAAMATTAAPCIGILILSTHFFRRKNQFHFHAVRPSLRRMLDICTLGASSLIAELSSGVVIIVFNLLLLKFSGNLGVAAYGIIANIALVLISIYTGIAQGIQPIVSRCYGSREYHSIKKVLQYALIVAAALSFLSYIIMFLYAAPITALFNKDGNPALAAIAEQGTRIYFTALLFIGINIIASAYLSCVERPGQAFLLSSLRGFLLIIPSAFLLSFLFGMTGVWLAQPITELLVTLPASAFLYRSAKRMGASDSHNGS